MAFTPIRRLRAAEQVAVAVRDAILAGRFQPGQALPSERDLADQFEVNRSTVREAIHRLEAWGLVEARHGGGTWVRDLLAHAGLHMLPFLLAPGGAPDPALLRDLLEIRVMLLAWTAGRAAERATPEGLAALREVLVALERAPDEQVQALDFRFFEVLVALTGNRVLGLLANGIREVYLQNQPLFASLYAHRPTTKLHRAVVEAVSLRDPEAAAAAMAAYARQPLDQFQGGDPDV